MKYDDANPLSIKEYGELLISKTFRDILNASDLSLEEKEEAITKVNKSGYKGGIGHVIEKYHFEYEINNDQEPDFPKAGVELKVTPYVQNKNGTYSAGERLVITMISYKHPVETEFLKSHVYKKMRLTLLVHYLRNRNLARVDYPIEYVTLFSPPEEDMKIIKDDYEKIIKKISEGRAHELSEGDTMYLGASTKGSNAEKSTVPQSYYAPCIAAKKRAFCLKNSYMTTILNKYVFNNVNTYDSILENFSINDTEETFEELIVNKINQYANKTSTELAKKFDIKKGSKNFYNQLAYRMLGVKSKYAEEFVKANIEVKAIRLEENGRIKESTSFPSFKFKELVQETWEYSTLYNTLSETKYLLVVYQKKGQEYVLKGCKLWNMSNKDLAEVQSGWEEIKEIIKEGPILEKKPQKDGKIIVNNNFPGKNKHRIIHIRPHTEERYYKFAEDDIIGNSEEYGDTLPDGRMMTKQSFWLNNTYMLEQIADIID